jgi:hypothetical protein
VALAGFFSHEDTKAGAQESAFALERFAISAIPYIRVIRGQKEPCQHHRPSCRKSFYPKKSPLSVVQKA